MMSLHLAFDPLFSPVVAALIGAVLAGMTGASLWFGGRGAWWRGGVLGIFFLVVLNPVVSREEREPLDDIAVVVVDRTSSQRLSGRAAMTARTLSALRETLAAESGIETREIAVDGTGETGRGTRLFGALAAGLSDVPHDRVAGIILLSDGQVHDVPPEGTLPGVNAPVHALLTGRPDEVDRRILVENAPRFGIVGGTISVTIRVEDSPVPPGEEAGRVVPVRVWVDGVESGTVGVNTRESADIDVRVAHGGVNVVELEAAALAGEIGGDNNRTVILVNGIRDRLRVLLVSGEPHPGERAWRNLLKADPAVDLVHFTILRPPDKLDLTPINDLSLIAFPAQELFEEKLEDFDLVIFDRYRIRGVLQMGYLENVANYVARGGAVLMAAGPSFASAFSLYGTPLSPVLPARPTGAVLDQRYRAAVTAAGSRHPVTSDLPGGASDPPAWGSWFRLIESTVETGEVVMDGPGGEAVVVLDRVGEGRVAQLMSDQAWLWTRGYEGGGPQAELLRRLAHWLMKEPDLEEERLIGESRGDVLEITRRTMRETAPPVQVTMPSGAVREVALEEVSPGRWSGRMAAEGSGLYRLEDGDLTAMAAHGRLNGLEFSDLRATADLLLPVVSASGGAVSWLGERDGAPPRLRRTRPGLRQGGDGWIGLQRNDRYVVRSVSRFSLFSGPTAVLAVLLPLLAGWWWEGRRES